MVIVVEGHHRHGYGDPSFALHLHPVRMRPASVPTGFHRTGKLDSTAEQKQFFCQRRLAGIRVRNNGEFAGVPRGGQTHRRSRRAVQKPCQVLRCRRHPYECKMI